MQSNPNILVVTFFVLSNVAFWKIHTYAFLVQLIYAANYSLAKMVMPLYIKPYAFILVRVLGATLLFFALSFFVKNKKNIAWSDVPKVVFASLFGVVFNMLLFFKGLSLTTPINASIIMLTAPLFVYIFGLFKDGSFIGLKSFFGLILSLSGAFFLVGWGGFSTYSIHMVGNVLILLNAMSYGFYLVYVKKLTEKYSSLSLIQWLFLSGLVFVLPVGFSELHQIELSRWSAMAYGILGFVVLGTTFLTYLLNFEIIKHGGSVLAGSYIYLQPALATMIAIFLGTDELSNKKIICTFVLILGLYLINSKKNG